MSGTTKRWIGNAAAIADLWTISLSDTVVSQAYSLTINGKSISYTAGGGDTISSILSALVTAWNSLVAPPPPEFQELIAAGLPTSGPFTSVTLKGVTSGKPSTISASTTGGATFSIANTTPATGPNDFANAQNWSNGIAPVNSDILVFDNGSTPCKYNLSTSLTGITLSVEQGYAGSIGLPFINSDSTTVYAEYRPTSLTLAGGTAIVNAPSLTRCNLAFGAHTANVRVLATGKRPDQYVPVVLMTGGDGSSELDISKGDVGVAFYQGTTATFPTIKTSYVTNAVVDVSLQCGPGATLTNVIKNGGTAVLRCSATTITQDSAGGNLTIGDSAAVTTLNVFNGIAALNSTGTVGTVNLYNLAFLDADQDPRAKTITNPINVHDSGVTIRDNQKSINSGTLSLTTNGVESVNVQHGGNISIVFT